MWHYVNGEETVGPISQGTISTLIEEGTVQPDTYVWRDGFEDWKPANAVAELSPAFPARPSSLTLRQRPNVYADKEVATGEDPGPITVDSLRKPLVAGTVASLEENDSGFGGWFLYVCPLEQKVFLATAFLAALGTGGVYLFDPSLWFTPFLVQGLICFFFGALMFRIRAFQAGILWGLGGMIFGFIDLIFIFKYWEMARRPLYLQLVSAAVLGAIVYFLPDVDVAGY